MALSVGTTLIVRRGQRRYAWVTLLPLAFLLLITTTASWQKIFAGDPRIGFLSRAASLKAELLAGTAADPAMASRLIVNAHINATLSGLFLLVTWAVVLSSARGWWSREPRTANREQRVYA